MQVLLTGPTGFVGGALRSRLLAEGKHRLRSACRAAPLSGEDSVGRCELGPGTDWRAALDGCTAVIHTAARVHLMNDQASDPLAEYRRVNVEGTLALARQAAAAGVRRFVFLSSIKVNGEQTAPGQPFSADTPPAPLDPYGVSKLEAEQGLLALAAETGMELVIIRPVLVYGPGVKANFAALMRVLAKGLPLPLGAIDNRRSLVALDNLVDLVLTCLEHPAAANQVFLVSDGESVSTTELFRRMGRALGKPARLLPLPPALLRLGAALLGRQALAQRLLGSLEVDIDKTCRLLGWQPPVSVDAALQQTARAYLGASHSR